MRGMRHPLTRALYEMCDEGVRVTHGTRQGVFDTDGRWLSGDRFSVCPNLCGWIGRGPSTPTDLSDNRRFRSVMTTPRNTVTTTNDDGVVTRVEEDA